MNAFFDKYLTSKTTLKQFVQQYELALRHKYEKEAQSEFDCLHKKPQLVSIYPFESQLSELYTVGVFKKVQLQIGKMIYCDITEEFNTNETFQYKVSERVLAGEQLLSKRFLVQNTSMNFTCDCRMFQHVGLLCCHVFVVLARLNPNALLPDSYILNRWRKDIQRSYREKTYPDDGVMAKDALRRHDDIMGRAVWIAQEAFISHKRYIEAVKCIEMLKARMHTTQNLVRPDEPESSGTSVLNPEKVRRIGRPPTRRRVSLAEKIIKKSHKKHAQQEKGKWKMKVTSPLHEVAPKPADPDFSDWDMSLYYEEFPP